MKVKLNLHTLHNPSCDILEHQINDDMKVTYGIYVKPLVNQSGRGNYIKQGHWEIPAGAEFMEVYVGENYNINSKKRSYSRVYYFGTDKAPKTHIELWYKMKEHYNELKNSGKLYETHKWE